MRELRILRDDDFYVYELLYPEEMGGAVFYVGRGHERRIYAHEGEARAIYYRANSIKVFRCFCPKCVIIRNIWAQGYPIVRKKIHENISRGKSTSLEYSVIKQLENSRILTNRSGNSRYSWMSRDELDKEEYVADEQFLQKISFFFGR